MKANKYKKINDLMRDIKISSANALVSHTINSAFIPRPVPSRYIVDYREKYIHTIKAADKLKFVECRNRLERVIKSRKNTPEEKSKSDSIEEKSKEWLTPEKLQQNANGEATGALHDQRKPSSPSTLNRAVILWLMLMKNRRNLLNNMK